MHEGELNTEPMLKSKIELSEQDGKILLDISDSTGGLGLKLFLDPIVASALGQRLADRARFVASQGVDDPRRMGKQEFPDGVAVAARAVERTGGDC